MWGSQTRNRNVSGLLTCGLWTCWSSVLEIRSMDWAGAWIQWCLWPDWWMRMIRAKYNYQDQKIDMWIICYAYLCDSGPVFCRSLVILDASCWILLSTRYLMMWKHVNKISSMIGREMVKWEVEMLIYAYLCVNWADVFELLIHFESKAGTLRILCCLGLICNTRRKSEFDRRLQLRGWIMMFSTYLSCWYFSLLQLGIPRFILPAHER